MRAHDHEQDGSEVSGPKAVRAHAPDADAAARAAASGRLDAVSAGGLLGLQRLAGNRAVAAALQDDGNRDRARPVRSPSIQRLVYVDGNPLKQLPKGGDAGAGDRLISKMIADKPSRYFKDEDELYKYAKGETEDIGYVAKKVDGAPAWIRLPGELLALGENHEKGEHVQMPDVADAVGTDNYMYERFLWEEWLSGPLAEATSSPASSSTSTSTSSSSSSSSSSAQPRLRGGLWDRIPDKLKEPEWRAGEDMWPQLWRGLEAFKVKPEKITELGKYAVIEAVDTVVAAEWQILQLAVFAASVSKGKFPKLHKVYLKHQDTLDPVLSPEYAQSVAGWRKKVTAEKALESVQALTSVVAELAKETEKQKTIKRGTYRDFGKRWQKQEGKEEYDDPAMVKAEKRRDYAMYRHILKAADGGILLYGFGDLHRKRLQQLLNEAGIKHMAMWDFLKEQTQNYPQ